MSLPEFTSFADELRGLDRRSKSELKQHIARSRELREMARERDLAELALCMNALGSLLAALGSTDEQVDAGELQGIVIRLVNSIERSAEGKPKPAATKKKSKPAGKQKGPSRGKAKPKPKASAPAEIPEDMDALGVPGNPPVPKKKTPTGKSKTEVRREKTLLGRILLELKQISRADLADALRMGRSNKLPLGECLLLAGKVEPAKVLEALGLQERLRAEASDPKPKAPKLGTKVKPYKKLRAQPRVEMHVTKEMFIGEVFLGADMINLDQLEKAMHLHHHKGVRVGDALVQLGAIDEAGLTRGLELQERLRSIARHSSADSKARVNGKPQPD